MEKKQFEWGERVADFVRISSVPGFREWLAGQTVPVIENAEDPYDWAYEHDYRTFVAGKEVTD